MMFERTIRVAFVFVVMAFSAQRVYSDIDDLACESLNVYKQVAAINAEMETAAGKEGNRIKEIEKLLKELNPEIIQEYTRQIQQYTAQIEDLKKRIVVLERKIEEVRNTDPNERADEATRLEAEAKKLRAREREISKPFNEKIDELKQQVLDKEGPFEEAMRQFCLIPGGAYSDVTRADASATFNSAFAHLRLRDKRSVPLGARMLDDTWYISNHSNNGIWVWAGHFHICFVMSRKDWQGKGNVAEAVKHFIDLKGLAKIDAANEMK
jgi:hypothetical protein